MTDRLMTLSENGEDIFRHNMAVSSIRSALSMLELRAITGTAGIQTINSTNTNSTYPKREVQPITEAARRALQSYGIGISKSIGSELAPLLLRGAASALRDRLSDLDSAQSLSAANVIRSLIEATSEAEEPLNILRRAVYAYSPYATLHTADDAQEKSIASLNAKIRSLSEAMAGLDVDQVIKRAQGTYEALTAQEVGNHTLV